MPAPLTADALAHLHAELSRIASDQAALQARLATVSDLLDRARAAADAQGVFLPAGASVTRQQATAPAATRPD